MSHQTQNDAVLRHLRNCGSISTMLAFKRYCITRLPARILELKKKHCINDVWVSRGGKRFKAWSLVEGERKAA